MLIVVGFAHAQSIFKIPAGAGSAIGQLGADRMYRMQSL